MAAREGHNPTLTRPIAAPLERCAELLGVELVALQEAAGHQTAPPVTDGAGLCAFCGATRGPFATVEGLFTVLICIPCLEVRQPQPDPHLGLHDHGPHPAMTRAEMRASLELLPSWVLAQKAAANRHVIAVMRRRLAAGEPVARMYQEPGLAWLERQAEAADQLLAERHAADQDR